MATSAFPATHPALGQEPVLPAGTPRLRPSLFRYPNLTTTVPKELVHRAAVAEVMLTDWERVDDTRFKVAAQWPRGHSFFTPIDGRYHDPSSPPKRSARSDPSSATPNSASPSATTTCCTTSACASTRTT